MTNSNVKRLFNPRASRLSIPVPLNARKREYGMTLIEVVIFIVVMGILGTTILSTFYYSLKNTPTVDYNAQAIALAEKRMDIIVGQCRKVGFATFTDLCVGSPSSAVCVIPSGFTVSSTITANWNSNANYKVITVTVSGLGSATLTSMVANY